MPNSFSNVYDDSERAKAYAALEFPGTYYLAFRDIPALIKKHVRGTRALDFGCGTGRSSRLLRDLGLSVVGVDISEPMLDVPDRRTVEDVSCSDRRYRELFAGAGLHVIDLASPRATGDEPIQWVNETRVAPWSVYALGADSEAGR
jgi:SAM-dependent methyltransferase